MDKICPIMSRPCSSSASPENPTFTFGDLLQVTCKKEKCQAWGDIVVSRGVTPGEFICKKGCIVIHGGIR